MEANIYDITNKHSMSERHLTDATLEEAERLAQIYIEGRKRGVVPGTVIIVLDGKVERVVEVTDVQARPRIAPGMGRVIARRR